MPASKTLWDRTTPLNNGTADSGINLAEGQPPSTLNNSVRAVMQREAQDYFDQGGVNTVGGTADAITVTLNDGAAAYVSGQHFTFKASASNTGAATINVNGIGAKALRKINAAGTDAALSAADIQIGQRVDVIYDATANAAAGAFIVKNPQPVEGSWTPAVQSDGPTGVSYTTQLGLYRRDVSDVRVQGLIILTSNGTVDSGTMRLTGLPFTSRNSQATAVIPCLPVSGFASLTGGLYLLVSPNTTQGLFYTTSATGFTAVTHLMMLDAAAFYFNGSYFI